LIGRQSELNVLKDALQRVRDDRSPQLVTIVGVPGIGKSRLVGELFRVIAEDPTGLISWRQGRSMPYGDGVAFWALGEMVKAQAGILATDSREEAERKLQSSVTEIISGGTDAPWVEAHLRPLVGLTNSNESASDRREEAFTAWRCYFEGLAEQNPLTLVFEDLQWADDNLLDFVEHLVDWASGVPMLILCNARPELLERRPGWGGGKRDAITLSLSPLSDEATAALLSSLSDRPVMAAEMQQALLARAGGNPLYAEQYVRMLWERGDADDLPLPETVQGIIAARLDALPIEEKTLLQTAAVMGKVFWLGAVATAAGLDRRTAEMQLHALERKDFVQRARRSSVADEAEYAFLHVLVRDVAYGQIPRGRRAEQHRLAAEWIGSLGRTEDHAEMLAHHYLSALELQRASGQPIDTGLSQRTLASTREAGDRSFSLNALTSAARFYDSALQLAADGSSERAQLLFKLGRTRFLSGDLDVALFEAARDELLACGDRQTAAEAEISLTEVCWLRGDRDRSSFHLGQARALVEGLEPSRATAYVISNISRFLMLSDENADAIGMGTAAFAMAEQLGLGELRAHALNNVGVARVHSADPGGIEDLEQSIGVAAQASAPGEQGRAMFNLAAVLWEKGQLERAVALADEGSELAARIGHIWRWRFARGSSAENLYQLGHWDDALGRANEFLAEVEAGSPHLLAGRCYGVRAQIRLGRDDIPATLADIERALEVDQITRDPQSRYQSIACAATVFSECGEFERASALADELLAELRAKKGFGWVNETLHVLAWTLFVLGRAHELLEVLPHDDVPWVSAARSFATGDLRTAADICSAMGAVTQEARDRLFLADALIDENRRAEADGELRRALAFYRSVGASRYIREAEGLLAASA
jgi:AAA ATPase domain